MKILYCVQRYGDRVGGGAESACRSFATRMADRGHKVEVLTSCATDYVTWANDYPEGTSIEAGVRVHRIPVRRPRTADLFQPISTRVLGRRVALAVQRDWVRLQGPDVVEIAEWLSQNAGRFDIAIFYTYLYATSVLALPIAARSTATLLHPAAHDEPPLELDVFDDLFAAAGGLSVHTPEELESVLRRQSFDRPVGVIGLGVDAAGPPGDGSRFRKAYHLGDDPVLLYVGRVEPAKGTDELVRYFIEHQQRNPRKLKLVMVGPDVQSPAEHPDVICTGFVDDQTVRDAYDAATVFVLPSYFESFSISLCEAWIAGKPALVQGSCAVLNGQARRSRGAIPYSGVAEFSVALDRLIRDEILRRSLGDAGRSYVIANYDWNTVLSSYERLIREIVIDRQADVMRLPPQGWRKGLNGSTT